MKGAKVSTATPEPVAGPSASQSQNRRSQPVRQTRMNPPRSQRGAASGQDGDTDSSDQPIDIFPAVTHFADALAALPKELVRHFTLLREVDAKIHAPEEELFQLTDACINAQMPEFRTLPDGVPPSTEAVAFGAEAAHNVEPRAIPNTLGGTPHDHTYQLNVLQRPNVPRRELFKMTARKISEMLNALEEKNHVISTANEALQKHLARMDNVWPHLENEFSDETKWGSTHHWAYPENRVKDGRRRDHVSAAALVAAEEAAARSDARKQAVAAKKEKKQQQQQHESELEEAKKSKSRRGGDGNTNGTSGVGLGITSGTATNGSGTTKRRKTEKGVASAASAASGSTDNVSSSTASNGKNSKVPPSPATSTIDSSRKRKAPTSASAQPKKSRNGAVASTTTSPVLGAIPDTTKTSTTHNSPQPTSAPRVPAPRGRQNSTHSLAEHGKTRRASISSNKTNGTPITPELGSVPPVNLPPRSIPEHPNTRDSNGTPKPEIKTEGEGTDGSGPASTAGSPRKRDAALARTDDSGRSTTTTPVLPPSIPMAMTKSGRVSKPSTPALATFQEASVRLRTSRSSDGSKDSKRKKGSTPLQQTVVEEGEVEGEDANEPTYCYCNGVSYGAMVACDANDCAREWFHLECVGLKVAPKTNVKWYCTDCKEKMKSGNKKSSR